MRHLRNMVIVLIQNKIENYLGSNVNVFEKIYLFFILITHHTIFKYIFFYLTDLY